MELDEAEIAQAHAVLRGLAFEDHLSPAEMDAVLKGFERREVVPGEVLITQGKTGEIFYILASGKVGIYEPGKLIDVRITELGPNSFFGEMALLEHDVRAATVKVEEAGVVFTLTRQTFEKVLLANPKLGDAIRKTAAARRNALRDRKLRGA